MDYPGRLYVAATLLPIASFVILLLAGAVRAAARPYRHTPLGASIYRAMGGDTPLRTGAFIATSAIGLAFVCSLVGFVFFLQDHHHPPPASPTHPAASGHAAVTAEHSGSAIEER